MKSVHIAVLIGVVTTIVLLWLGISSFATKDDANLPKMVKFGNSIVNVKVAHTSKQRAKGLMYTESMKEDDGMLFIFPYERQHTFWMANTYIPLDIIWINENMEIVHIEENVPSCTQPIKLQNLCKIYKPEAPAKYVVETNAGWTAENSITTDTPVEFMN